MGILHAAALAVALSAGTVPSAEAQTSIPPVRAGSLRLGELYRELEIRSPQIRAARGAAAAADARIGPSRRPPDPEIQLGTMNRNFPGFGLNDPLGMNQVQLMQMLPIAGKLGLAARAARERAGAAAHRATDVAWEQRTRVAEVFYELYRSDHSLTVAHETRSLVRDLAGTAEGMYRVGEGRQTDVLRAQVEVARMTEDIIRMEAMRQAQNAQLHALLDSPSAESVGTPVLPAYPDSLPSVDSLVALALVGRPMLRAGDREVAAAAAVERRAGREMWPDLRFGVVYGQRGMPEGGTDRMMSFMLGATIPIWAGSRQGEMRREAAAMREMAEAELAAMQAETRARVVELVADIGRAYRLARLYRGDVLPQARATVTSALAAYRTGRVDFMTVLDARMTENRYRTELIALEADAGRALAELEMLIATPLLDPDSVNSSATGGAR
jgi:outer membrane protein TolC